MKKLFKRLLPLCLVIYLTLSNTIVAYAGITDYVYLPGNASWGRTGYGYRIGLGVCFNETYTGHGGDQEALAEWILNYGSKYYVHAQGNPYYVTKGAGAGGFAGYYTTSETPCNTDAPESIVGLINDIGVGATYLDVTGNYSYIKEDKIDEIMLALKPTAPDLYTMWLNQKNSSNFCPVVIVVEAVIGCFTPDGKHWALDSYDLYNLTPAATSASDLLTTNIAADGFEDGGKSLTGGYIGYKAGMFNPDGSRNSGRTDSDSFPWRLYKGMFNCKYGRSGRDEPLTNTEGYGAGALLAVQDFYNKGGTPASPRIDGCYIINVGAAAPEELTGSYTWHIDAEDLPTNSYGHSEDAVVKLNAAGTTTLNKSCSVDAFDLSQSNYADWITYFDKYGITSVEIKTKVYHTGTSADGGSGFSSDYAVTFGKSTGALVDKSVFNTEFSITMGSEEFLKYLNPQNTDDFPLFDTGTSKNCTIGSVPQDNLLACAFATEVKVKLNDVKEITLTNKQCHWAIYDLGNGKFYRYLQDLDDSSTQVKVDKLDDGDDHYEAMAGTPTTEDLFISQGANQWVVNMQYRYANDDYTRAYTLKTTEPVENYLYYYVADGGTDSYSHSFSGNKGHSNTSDDNKSDKGYGYYDNEGDANAANTADYHAARNTLISKLRSIQASYDSNHAATEDYHYEVCTLKDGTECDTCKGTNVTAYDEIQKIIEDLEGYSSWQASSINAKGPGLGSWSYTLFSTGNDADLDSEVKGDVTIKISFEGKVEITALDGEAKPWVTSYCVDATCSSGNHASGVSACTSDCPTFTNVCSTSTTSSHSNFNHNTHTCTTNCKSIPATGCPSLVVDPAHVCTDNCKTENCDENGKYTTCTEGAHVKTEHNHFGSEAGNKDHVNSSIFSGNTWTDTYEWTVSIKYADTITKDQGGKRGKMLSEDTTLYQTFEDVKYMDIVDYHVWQLVGGKEKGLGAILTSKDASAVFDLACKTKGYVFYNAQQTNWGTYTEDAGDDTLVWRYAPVNVAGTLAAEGRLANSFSAGSKDLKSPTMTLESNVEDYKWTPKLKETEDTILLEYNIEEQGGRSHMSIDAYLKQALAPVFYESSSKDDAYRNYLAVQSDFLTLGYGDAANNNLTFCGLQYNTDDYSKGDNTSLYQAVMTTSSNAISQFFTDNENASYKMGDLNTAPQITNPSNIAPQEVSPLGDLQQYAYMGGKVPLNTNDIYKEYTRLDLNGNELGEPSPNAINTADATSFTNINLKTYESMPYIGLKSAEGSHSIGGHGLSQATFLSQSYDPNKTFVNGGRSSITFEYLGTSSGARATANLTLVADGGSGDYYFPESGSNSEGYNVHRTLANNTYPTGYGATMFNKVLNTTEPEVTKLNASGGIEIALYNNYVDCNENLLDVATEYITDNEKAIVHGSGYIGTASPVNDVVIFNPVSASSARIYLGSETSSDNLDDVNEYVTDGVTQTVTNPKVIRDQRVAPYVISTQGEEDILAATNPDVIDLSEQVINWNLIIPSKYKTDYYTKADYTTGTTSHSDNIGTEVYTIKDSGTYYMKHTAGIVNALELIAEFSAGDKLHFEGNTLWLHPYAYGNINLTYEDLYNAVVAYYSSNPTTEMLNAYNNDLDEYQYSKDALNAELSSLLNTVDASNIAIQNATQTYDDAVVNAETIHEEAISTAQNVYDASIAKADLYLQNDLDKATTTTEVDKAWNKYYEAIEIAETELNNAIEDADIIYDNSLSKALATYEKSLTKYDISDEVTARIVEIEEELNELVEPVMSYYVHNLLDSTEEALTVPSGSAITFNTSNIVIPSGAVIKLTLPVTCAGAKPTITANCTKGTVTDEYSYYDEENGQLIYYFEFSDVSTMVSIGVDFNSTTNIKEVEGSILNFEDIVLFDINENNISNLVSAGTITYSFDTESSLYKNLSTRNSMYNDTVVRRVAESGYSANLEAGSNIYYIGNTVNNKLNVASLANPHKVWNSNWKYYVIGWRTINGDIIESVDSDLLKDDNTILLWPWANSSYIGSDNMNCSITVGDLKQSAVLVKYEDKVYVTTKDAVSERIIREANIAVSCFDFINLCNSTHRVTIDNAVETGGTHVYPLTSGLGVSGDTLTLGAYEFCFKLTDEDGPLYLVDYATNLNYRLSKDDIGTSYLTYAGYTESTNGYTKSGDTVQFDYELDWEKEVTTLNQQPVITGGGDIVNASNFISLDDCFSIYWDNTGKFSESPGYHEQGATSPQLGFGWDTGLDSEHVATKLNELTDWFGSRGDTDTSKWINNKYITFNFPVYVFYDTNDVVNPTVGPYSKKVNEDGSVTWVANKSKYIPAGTPIALGTYEGDSGPDDNGGHFKDYGAPGVTLADEPYTYKFWCPLEASEMYNAVASCHVEAINSTQGKGNSKSTNRVGQITSYYRYTDACNNLNTAIVGRIGALTIADSGDINYSDSFKYSVNDSSNEVEDYYIYPLIRKVANYDNDKLKYSDGNLSTSVNSGKQKKIVVDPYDVRGRLGNYELKKAGTEGVDSNYQSYITATSAQNGYNTYGTQWFKNKVTNDNNTGTLKSELPLTSDFNVHSALKQTEQKLGYELYLSLESIGCYYGTSDMDMSPYESDGYANASGDYNQRKIQIRPVYLATNAYNAKGDAYTGPVDVYMNMGGTYVQINSGVVENEEGSIDYTDALRTVYNSYYPYSIETNTGSSETDLDQNMQRRMVTDSEASITKNVLDFKNHIDRTNIGDLDPNPEFGEGEDFVPVVDADELDVTNGFTSLLSKKETTQDGLGTTNMNNSYVYGNAQYLFLRERNRTFIGGTSIAVDKTAANGMDSNRKLLTNMHGQKWYFGLGLPASAVFVPAGQSFTADKILHTGYIITTVDVYAVGDVWTLHYKSPLSETALDVDPEGRTVRELTGDIPEFKWLIPVSYYNLENSTSRDDLDTEGSH